MLVPGRFALVVTGQQGQQDFLVLVGQLGHEMHEDLATVLVVGEDMSHLAGDEAGLGGTGCVPV